MVPIINSLIYALVSYVTLGSDNGLSPGRRQAIIWNNAGILLIWSYRDKLQWNIKRNSYIFIQQNAFENVACKMALYLGLDVLNFGDTYITTQTIPLKICIWKTRLQNGSLFVVKAPNVDTWHSTMYVPLVDDNGTLCSNGHRESSKFANRENSTKSDKLCL